MKRTFSILIGLLLCTLVSYAQSWQTLYNQGVDALSKQDYKTASQTLEKALPIAEKEFTNKHENYLNTLTKLGEAYLGTGEQGKGRACYLSLITIMKELKKERTKEYAEVLNIIGNSYTVSKDAANAERYLTQAVSATKMNIGEKSKEHLLASHDLARFHKMVNRYEKADPLYAFCYKLGSEVLGSKNIRYAEIAGEAGETAFRLKNDAQAIEYLSRYIELMKGLQQPSSTYNQAYNTIALAHKNKGNNKEAIAMYKTYLGSLGELPPAQQLAEMNRVIKELDAISEHEASLALREQKLAFISKQEGKITFAVCEAQVEIADNKKRLKNYTAAETTYKEAIKNMESLSMSKEQELYFADVLNKLAALYKLADKTPESEAAYLQSVKFMKEKTGGTHPAYSKVLDSLAVFYENTARPALADSLFKEAMAIRKKQPNGDKHPDYASSLMHLARMQSNKQKYDQAEPLLKQAQFIQMSYHGKGSLEYAEVTLKLAKLYQQKGNLPDALKTYRGVLDLSKRLYGEGSPMYQQILANIAQVNEEMNQK